MKPDQELTDYVLDCSHVYLDKIKDMLKNTNVTEVSRRTLISVSLLYRMRDAPEEKLLRTRMDTIFKLMYLIDKGEVKKYDTVKND